MIKLRCTIASVMFFLFVSASLSQVPQEPSVTFNPALSAYIEERVGEFSLITPDRKEQLRKIATYVEQCSAEKQPVRLTFICTHNSRRSHFSQVWAAVAAKRYGVNGVFTYSGGTEATAMNHRSVAALDRAGFHTQRTSEDENPVYLVMYAEGEKPLACFSKVYNQAPNPRTAYAAIMTCSEADRSCPAVQGAATRIAIPFEDPKVADGTPSEQERYDERCAQVAREMLYVFSHVTK